MFRGAVSHRSGIGGRTGFGYGECAGGRRRKRRCGDNGIAESGADFVVDIDVRGVADLCVDFLVFFVLFCC